MAMASQGQLDLHWWELHHGDAEAGQGHHQDPPGLDHGDGGAGAVEEELLDGRQLRLPGADQHPQVLGDFDHPIAIAAAGIGADDPAIEHGLGSIGALFDINHAVAHTSQTGIDAEDPQGP